MELCMVVHVRYTRPRAAMPPFAVIRIREA
jgi:hypothetical protein